MVFTDYQIETERGIYYFEYIQVKPYGSAKQHAYKEEFWGHVETVKEWSVKVLGVDVVIDGDVTFVANDDIQETVKIKVDTNLIMMVDKHMMENYLDELAEDEDFYNPENDCE